LHKVELIYLLQTGDELLRQAFAGFRPQ
jgi:hypothetical protein